MINDKNAIYMSVLSKKIAKFAAVTPATEYRLSGVPPKISAENQIEKLKLDALKKVPVNKN